MVGAAVVQNGLKFEIHAAAAEAVRGPSTVVATVFPVRTVAVRLGAAIGFRIGPKAAAAPAPLAIGDPAARQNDGDLGDVVQGSWHCCRSALPLRQPGTP